VKIDFSGKLRRASNRLGEIKQNKMQLPAADSFSLQFFVPDIPVVTLYRFS
jgi:hypothetical protein